MKNFRRQIENQKHLKRRYMMDNLQQMEQEKHVLRWGGLGGILRRLAPSRPHHSASVNLMMR